MGIVTKLKPKAQTPSRELAGHLIADADDLDVGHRLLLREEPIGQVANGQSVALHSRRSTGL